MTIELMKPENEGRTYGHLDLPRIPLSRLLRDATSEVHAEVENGTEFNRLIVTLLPGVGSAGLSESVRRARAQYMQVYETFLVAAYGFETAVLDAIGSSGFLQESYVEEAAHTPTLILRDLAELPHRKLKLGTMRGLPVVSSLAELAGVEYVRRGSRKGNAVIARSVHRNLGLTAENGAAFLNMNGRETAPRFELVRNWLDAMPLSESEREIAIASAIETFRCVGRWHKMVESF